MFGESFSPSMVTSRNRSGPAESEGGPTKRLGERSAMLPSCTLK